MLISTRLAESFRLLCYHRRFSLFVSASQPIMACALTARFNFQKVYNNASHRSATQFSRRIRMYRLRDLNMQSRRHINVAPLKCSTPIPLVTRTPVSAPQISRRRCSSTSATSSSNGSHSEAEATSALQAGTRHDTSNTGLGLAARPAPVPSRMHAGTLLLSCPDQKGVIAALSTLLFGLGCNILESDQVSGAGWRLA